MSIQPHDLKFYGSATMPDTDATTAIGGAIALTKTVSFSDTSGLVQAVSSDAGDTTQNVQVFYRDASGLIQNISINLNGQTVVPDATSMERLMKVLKSATCAGDVAVEAQTATRANTGQAGGGANHEIAQILGYIGSTKVATVSKNWAGGAGAGTNVITLDAGASAVDGFYNGQVIRMTDVSIGFRISNGFYLEKSPNEITEVRRIFYDAAADPATGGARTYYEKIFTKNVHGTLSLTAAVVAKVSDTGATTTFGVTAALNDSTTNGTGNNRQVAPASIVFDASDKSVVGGGTLAPGDAQGVWLKLALTAGEAAQKVLLTMGINGQTV